MKKENFAEVSTQDLRDRLVEMRKDYAQLQINHAISPLDSPAKITHARKEIARVLTELRARELNNK
ncbi:MAG: 50S ribosomal protein L29 [Duncaniella sp.]|nr:50S ribosomal protein L29 [Duncaniella sp.]MDE5751069.1 50S ribosomal protein L29 [Duncaniella sp.]MDE5919887.1 50S ribosomal protein L29 [Duncaniella sp.]MDE6328772.1 50S ribosomal protein L29 [Duncaniella sp.]MDE6573460.1 50S ribosomal protein L29 [Duncaniella sp.]